MGGNPHPQHEEPSISPRFDLRENDVPDYMLSKFKYDKYCLLLKTIEVFLRAENYLTENGKGSIQGQTAEKSN
jgi:hypothetical protein